MNSPAVGDLNINLASVRPSSLGSKCIAKASVSPGVIDTILSIIKTGYLFSISV